MTAVHGPALTLRSSEYSTTLPVSVAAGQLMCRVAVDPRCWPAAIAALAAWTLGGTLSTAGEPLVGVTIAEAADSALVPIALVAATVNVYGWSLVRPSTAQARAPVVVHCWESGLEVTV